MHDHSVIKCIEHIFILMIFRIFWGIQCKNSLCKYDDIKMKDWHIKRNSVVDVESKKANPNVSLEIDLDKGQKNKWEIILCMK